MIGTKFVRTVSVVDPDTNLPVEVEIRKMETGGMVGLDESFLTNTEYPTYSPYDRGVKLDVMYSDEDDSGTHGYLDINSCHLTAGDISDLRQDIVDLVTTITTYDTGMFITVPDQADSDELDRLVINGILSESFKAMIHRAWERDCTLIRIDDDAHIYPELTDHNPPEEF